jgi:hypothetical protein
LLNRGRRRCRAIIHLADETKPALEHRSNETLVGAAVAKRAPCGADAGAERRLRDDAALPNHVEQLFLADDPVAIANEVNDQIEDLRLDANNRSDAPQFVPRDVDLEIGETEVQGFLAA